MKLFIACLAGAVVAGFAQGTPGAVYTMTNAAAGNDVVIFKRAADGTLTPGGSVATGGLGTGGGLGNQGGLVLSRNRQWLFAVNAGSHEISVFRVEAAGLMPADKVNSGGLTPVSVTAFRNLLYVLNAGSDNVTGFRLSADGKLAPIPGATRGLSAMGAAAAQVSFSPEGDQLVVTEKATNKIDVYPVGADGTVGEPKVHASAGATPFGFAFGIRDQLFVSEAFGGAPDASAVSSYVLAANGDLTVVTPSAPTTETAACWVALSLGARFAYTTNTGSHSVSGYRIAENGALTPLDADGRTGLTGAGPIDMAFSGDGRFLYTLNFGDGTLSAFRLRPNGSLEAIMGAGGLPLSANGLAAR